MNVRNIRKTRQNFQILHNENDLEESQLLELTHYINLTMIQDPGTPWSSFTSSMPNCWYLITMLANTMEAMNYLHVI